MSKPQRTTLYLPPELWKATKIEAIKRGVSATELVTLAIADYLTKSKSQEVKDAAIDFKQKQAVGALSTLYPKRKGGKS